MMLYRILPYVLLLLLVACKPSAGLDATTVSQGFTIHTQADTATITVYSPWQQGAVMSQLAITQPIERVVCTSATHIGFLSELGMLHKVVGVCRPERVYSLSPEDRLRIQDIGDDLRPNMESILLLRPDVVVLSTYAKGDMIPQQVAALGIPVLFCNEWTEATPLARAAWIKVFGAAMGCQSRADSIYDAVCQSYSELVSAELHGERRSLMSGMSYRGTWYVPAGGTFMGHLFRDAGAAYQYEDDPSTFSIPLRLEQALQDFAQADVWVGCEAWSLDELQSIDPKHTWFRSYQTQEVYNFRRRTLPSGANDFWESGVVHPERILLDLQRILRGDTTQLYYSLPLR